MSSYWIPQQTYESLLYRWEKVNPVSIDVNSTYDFGISFYSNSVRTIYRRKPKNVNIICRFCNRGIATVSSRGKKDKNNRVIIESKTQDVLRDHTWKCAEEWAWGIMCKRSMGLLRSDENKVVKDWLNEWDRSVGPDIRKWLNRGLPKPVGSLEVIALEIAFHQLVEVFKD